MTVAVIAPVTYQDGQPILIDCVFTHETLYAVISGQYAGQRGTALELKYLCGTIQRLDLSVRVLAETGLVLVRVGNSWRPACDLVI